MKSIMAACLLISCCTTGCSQRKRDAAWIEIIDTTAAETTKAFYLTRSKGGLVEQYPFPESDNNPSDRSYYRVDASHSLAAIQEITRIRGDIKPPFPPGGGAMIIVNIHDDTGKRVQEQYFSNGSTANEIADAIPITPDGTLTKEQFESFLKDISVNRD